ncbi:MAG TPA: hypothetical protein VGO43_09185 [Pyrinomonadaceae bacterium]|jgi:hypothetical protein|nr:hypothetical protein [Pyrinomonadaceae bacterium]
MARRQQAEGVQAIALDGVRLVRIYSRKYENIPDAAAHRIVLIAAGGASFGQSPSPTPLSAKAQAQRDAMRERLRTLLDAQGQKQIGVTFTQSTKQPYNFIGTYKNVPIRNAQSYEVVIGVTPDNTIGFRIYPHYNDHYVNIDKARNSLGLAKQMANLSYKNFLYWGADDTGDIMAGYTFTLESGFPEESMIIVLRSIPLLDQYLGQMRPNIDGSSGQ